MPDMNSSFDFSRAPSESRARSVFSRDSRHVFTGNVGDVIPFFIDEVLPGDTFNVTTSKVVRLQTLLDPIFDNLYLDTYYFFVPLRLTWEHFVNFCGENTESAWIPDTIYTIPKISSPANGWSKGTIADYLGIPPGVEFTPAGTSPDLNYDHFPSALPFRAYALIMDHFFRDQNLTDPLLIPTDDSMQSGSNGDDYITDVANGGKPFVAAKLHDYFSSALPSSQKGLPLTFETGGFPGGSFPVYTFTPGTPIYDSQNFQPMQFQNFKWDGTAYVPSSSSHHDSFANPRAEYIGSEQLLSYTRDDATWSPSINSNYIAPNNLAVTIPPVQSSFMSINQLRLLMSCQQMLELAARSGSRYGELVKGLFGVTNPDSRLQSPEYLGGNRIRLNVTQINNTAASADVALGETGANSFTADLHGDFVKSFTEHGYVIGVCVARYRHTYSDSLERFWTRTNFLDFFNPVFSNIGEMPLFTDEIYCDGYAPDVFGYQEAWASYRYKPSRVSSEMRNSYAQALDSWHFADHYAQRPVLSDEWIREDKGNVDRTLAVTSAVADQFLADFSISNTCTRVMPLFSIPGLTKF